MASVYVHLPFCVRKCAYCDFASFPGREADMDKYIRRLTIEAEEAARTYAPLFADTLYFGGGTPSLLPPGAFAHLMDGLRAAIPLRPGAEVSVECNPGTVTPEKLAEYRRAGVNRLSIGVQSLSDDELRLLGRVHDASDARRAVRMAREADFNNVSLDLIFALPGQTPENFRETLFRAAELSPEHLSCYSLILEDGTPLTQRVKAGELPAPDEETALEMQSDAVRILREAGYLRYEISNYARPGFESRHNAVYWTRGEYLGLGCAAHSLMREARFANTASLDAYLRGAPRETPRPVPPDERREEAILLGLRTSAGVLRTLLAGKERALSRMAEAGLVVLDGERARLTDKGMDVHSAIVLELVT